MAALAVPFDCIPQAATRAIGLSDRGYRVYTLLVSFANRKSGLCNPKEKTLAAKLGKSLKTIQRAITELRSAGIIVARRSQAGNRYELTTPERWWATKTPGSDATKVSHPDATKVSFPMRQKCPVRGLASLYEPDVFQLERGSGAAVKPSDSVQLPPETPAAAPHPPGEKKTEHPAAPPVDVQKAEQLGLDLQEADTLRATAIALVDDLHAVHPQPGLPEKAVDETERILRASQDVEASVELIRRNHATWKAHWEMFRPGQFIPQLWRWFRDGEWRRTVGKPVRHENFYEREERKWKEEENSEARQWMREYEAEQLRKRYGETA